MSKTFDKLIVEKHCPHHPIITTLINSTGFTIIILILLPADVVDKVCIQFIVCHTPLVYTDTMT